MSEEIKLILALQQVKNLESLLENNEYESFFVSHLLPIKIEIERQLSCLTGYNSYTKIKE